jgi:hypothetical protein
VSILGEKKAAKKAAKKKLCCLCGKKAELENDNGTFICENCADSISSYAVDV